MCATRAADPLTRRIMVVEDTRIVAREIEQLLAELSCDVVGSFATAEEALAAAESEEIDGALLDINLQGVPSYAVADRLRQRGVPLIFLTGYSPRAMPLEYRDLPCLEKPFSADEFREMMAQTFGIAED